MKIYQGGYQIAAKMGYTQAETTKISNFLNLIDTPMKKTEKGKMAYILTDKQIRFLKMEIRKIKKLLKKLK